MITLNNDYFFFTAKAEENGSTYILNPDFTVHVFSTGSGFVWTDNIEPKHLFDDVKVLKEANKRQYDIEVFDHVEFDSDERRNCNVYKTKKVTLKFKPQKANVKISYFE